MPEIILEYEDGRTVRIERNIRNLADAFTFALDLADRAGKFQGDGHGPPKFVKIYSKGFLELSIAVLPGGLLTPSSGQQFRPT